jgi:hypothetical protein
MEFFYDGQIRRYLIQTMRVFSNFVVKYGDGSLVRVPVMYGDADRQVASIIRNNSENKVNSVPRIAVYVDGLALDRERLADSSYVGKVNVRERGTQIDTVPGSPTYGEPVYNQAPGRNYTIERLMPTPFKLSIKVDLWTASTEQKLQLLEQILVLFNPSLELQTTDNYIDWTSLSVLNLNETVWSSRQVPVGNDTPIDITTLKLDTPVWLSPPAKVKHLGVITKIVTSLYNSAATNTTSYVDGLGSDMPSTTTFTNLIDISITTAGQNAIEVIGSSVLLLNPSESVMPNEPTPDPAPVRQGLPLSWREFLLTAGGTYVAGSSMIHLQQPNGSYVVGTFVVNALDESKLSVNWNPDTLTTNTGIDSTGKLDSAVGYNGAGSYRPNSTGTFDAIINPLTYNPDAVVTGTRYLLVDDIGNINNVDPATEWGALVAYANDIIEWTGSAWRVVFAHSQFASTMVWQTNIYTGVQYLWNGVSWVKSYEGEYRAGQWKIVL